MRGDYHKENEFTKLFLQKNSLGSRKKDKSLCNQELMYDEFFYAWFMPRYIRVKD
jgi:hypothetical protein